MELIKEIRLARVDNSLIGRVIGTTRDNEGKLIKERGGVQVNCVGVIRLPNYSNSWVSLQQLVETAKRDFPCLVDSDIRVIQYGGIRYKGTFGIEFNLPDETTLPDGYYIIDKLEPRK